MLDKVRIAGVDLHEYSGARADRAIARAEALVGLAAPRVVSRPKSEAHGSNNRTRWLSEKPPVLEGEVWGDTLLDAYDDFDVITAAFYRTLSDGAQLLEWRKPDPRNGLNNILRTPYVRDDYGVGFFDVTGGNVADHTNAGATLTPVPADETLQIDTTNATAVEGIAQPLLGTFLAGHTYTFYLDIRGNVGGEQLQLAFGALLDRALPTVVLTNGMARYSATWTPGADAVNPWVAVRTLNATAMRFFTRAWHIVEAPASAVPPIGYDFDGDTEYAWWSGTAGASSAFFDATMQAYAKLAGPILPPIEEGAALLKYQAQLETPDPRGYHSHLKTCIGAALAAGGGGLTFPMRFPVTFTESAGGVATVTNRGNIETPPVIRIYGPITSPRVILVTTGEQVKITGELLAGDWLELDHAKRTVKLNGQTLRMNLLDTTASKFFDVPPGTHDVRLVAVNFGGAAHHELDLRDAYGG